MKILVTGANGLLGHHVVETLLHQNEEVRIIVRSTANLLFDTSKVECIQGDFTDKQTISEALQGCRAVVHCAAVTATHLIRPDEYYRVNTDATIALVDSCLKMKVKRFIYVSTVNTIGFGTNQHPADETTPMCFPFDKSWYALSKKKTENHIDNLSTNKDIEIIILHPSFIIGSMDTKPGSGRLLLLAYRKWFMAVPSGGKNFVSVRKVAQACYNALYTGKPGSHYIISDENLSFAAFYNRMKRVGVYRQKTVVIPDILLKLIAKAGDLLQLAGIPTDLCTRNIQQLLIQEYYSGAKADRELGLNTGFTLDQAIEEAIDWFRKNGYC
ncbi:MAG: NAD-dependent epimerase/dehydratase family protein [Paludibacter sp.]|jgi:nucleoside-diphosphate-sugar epimerase|nr:NAD-dependent epimerase/dehydratase family protein [Paludibacter sp.]